MSDRRIERFVPLKPAAFHVLITLLDQDRHGYGIIKDVEERTDGALILEPGSLYRLLKRMLSDGLIEQTDERPSPAEDDRRRRYYRVSSLGRAVAAAETARLRRLVEHAEQRPLQEPGTA